MPTCFGRPVTTTGTSGTPGPDVIVGTAGADVIDGLGGNDLMCGLGGDDRLIGGPGADPCRKRHSGGRQLRSAGRRGRCLRHHLRGLPTARVRRACREEQLLRPAREQEADALSRGGGPELDQVPLDALRHAPCDRRATSRRPSQCTRTCHVPSVSDRCT
ncbi:calcium-binding protein [Streptomyces mirabilis]|uniref:calcium-binding protein n=1 Tax=Streptomyces mirabilis TaxID=68239 RepID=UPI003653175C